MSMGSFQNLSAWASLLSGLQVLPHPSGEVTSPVVHQDTPAFEQVGAGIGRLHAVPDHMRQGRFNDLSRVIRFPRQPSRGNSIGTRAAQPKCPTSAACGEAPFQKAASRPR